MPRPRTPPLPYEEKLLEDDGPAAGGRQEAQDDCKRHPYLAALSCLLFIAVFVWGIYSAVTMKTPP